MKMEGIKEFHLALHLLCGASSILVPHQKGGALADTVLSLISNQWYSNRFRVDLSWANEIPFTSHAEGEERESQDREKEKGKGERSGEAVLEVSGQTLSTTHGV